MVALAYSRRRLDKAFINISTPTFLLTWEQHDECNKPIANPSSVNAAPTLFFLFNFSLLLIMCSTKFNVYTRYGKSHDSISRVLQLLMSFTFTMDNLHHLPVLWTESNLPSNCVNRHRLTISFMICCWQYSQTADLATAPSVLNCKSWALALAETI